MINRILALILIIVLLPLEVAIAISVVVFSGFPVFFKQKRTGLRGKPFFIYKFRTMKVGADRQQKKLKHLNEVDGPVFKIRNDPRLTRIGRFLFHTGLDELPQLFNVFRGDMEIVGPRPLPIGEAKEIDKKYQKRHEVKPGIISPWVLNGYHSMPFKSWMESDIDYVENKNWLNDLIVLLRGGGMLVRLVRDELLDILTRISKSV